MCRGAVIYRSRNRRVTKAIDAIDETEWTPVHYPGAVLDPETGALISDAEVAGWAARGVIANDEMARPTRIRLRLAHAQKPESDRHPQPSGRTPQSTIARGRHSSRHVRMLNRARARDVLFGQNNFHKRLQCRN
jgi:hypothetical protein